MLLDWTGETVFSSTLWMSYVIQLLFLYALLVWYVVLLSLSRFVYTAFIVDLERVEKESQGATMAVPGSPGSGR